MLIDILTESRAIAQYIAAKYRGQGIELSPTENDIKAYATFQQVRNLPTPVQKLDLN
jgi:glutathione S-transferase